MPPVLRVALSLLVAVGLVWVPASPAPAAAKQVAPKILVDPQVVPRGESAAIRGNGWNPGSRLRLSIGLPRSEAYPIGTVAVDGRGRFVKRVKMRGLPDLYVVLACPTRSCPAPVRTTVRIVARTAGAPTLLHSDLPRSRYLERPRKVGYRGPATAGTGVNSIQLLRLSWRDWGQGRAKASGRARVCSDAGCRSVPARILATRRVRYESKQWFYARLAVRLRADAGLDRRRLALCTLPATCGGQPGPP